MKGHIWKTVSLDLHLNESITCCLTKLRFPRMDGEINKLKVPKEFMILLVSWFAFWYRSNSCRGFLIIYFRQEKMMELGSHTVRSHGVTVARIHMHDWLILMLLVAIYVILNRIDPFHRFIGKDMMADLKYPLKDNTVPSWSVPVRNLSTIDL